jgi:transposase
LCTTDEKIKDLYDRLKRRSKKSMVAIVACMRKMLVQLNAIMKRELKKNIA